MIITLWCYSILLVVSIIAAVLAVMTILGRGGNMLLFFLFDSGDIRSIISIPAINKNRRYCFQ